MRAPRYLVPARDVSVEIEIKRSRFLCRLERVGDEEAARAVVAAARSRHWDAGHHCSAFVIGPDGQLQRSNDDGEPAGTAGMPMLEVLRGAGVSDAVAVVTRWFGGILLGAGGLVRAYGDAVREALAQAGTRERALRTEVGVDLPHAHAGRFEADVRSRGVSVLDVAYAESARFRLGTDDPDALAVLVAELTAGTVTPEPLGTTWVDL